MGLPILGKIQNMFSITRDMILRYQQQNYYGKNIIIAAAGSIDHDMMCNFIQKYFGGMRPDPATPRKIDLSKP